MAIHAPEQPVLMIGRGGFRIGPAAQSIGPAKYQGSDEPSLRPSPGNEPSRQVIEQLGMGRPRSGQPKIIDRADDPLAEQLLPDAIDNDPRRERIVVVSDPVSQLAPPALPTGKRRPRGAPRPYLKNIFVIDEFRGEGIASRLIEACRIRLGFPRDLLGLVADPRGLPTRLDGVHDSGRGAEDDEHNKEEDQPLPTEDTTHGVASGPAPRYWRTTRPFRHSERV